jgi:hypothetical protein
MQGGCLCGAVRYEVASPAVGQAVCHCKHCQRQSGSAFSVLLAVTGESFTVSGQPTLYVDRGDSGAVVNRYFCSSCGSPLYTALPDKQEVVYIKAGTLDDTSVLAPKVHVWCDSAWPWTAFPQNTIKIGKNPPARR